MSLDDRPIDRRQWMSHVSRCAALGGIGSLAGWLLYKQAAHAADDCRESATTCDQCDQASGCRRPQVWQLDPNRCVACGRCQTNCVLDQSAVKAVNCFALCGYCDNCTGYFPTKDYSLNTGAENQLCPTGAIARKFIEKKGGVPYFEYTIDERLCIACGKCVVGCRLMNGSLYLQVRHDRCLNCNECSIAVNCPADAFRRVPATSVGLLSRAAQAAEGAQERKREVKAKSQATRLWSVKQNEETA
jgi:Na+-translocating ferredoxin:NAD+ oxidoreductase subunit B